MVTRAKKMKKRSSRKDGVTLIKINEATRLLKIKPDKLVRWMDEGWIDWLDEHEGIRTYWFAKEDIEEILKQTRGTPQLRHARAVFEMHRGVSHLTPLKRHKISKIKKNNYYPITFAIDVSGLNITQILREAREVISLESHPKEILFTQKNPKEKYPLIRGDFIIYLYKTFKEKNA